MVQRYEFFSGYADCHCTIVEDSHGDFVQYADYLTLLDENVRLRAELAEQLEQGIVDIPGMTRGSRG